MKRPFVFGVLIGSLVGLIAGASVAFIVLDRIHAMGQPMARLAAAAESSTYTYQLYLYAPYPVAEEHLNNHASLLLSLADESPDESERGTYLRDLAVNQARLAKLAERNSDPENAASCKFEHTTLC